MDVVSKKLLDIVQRNFPEDSRPFLTIAEELEIDEEEVINRIKKLKKDGYIRRLGGIFNSKKLGYRGTLCAMKVPDREIDNIAEVVNGFSEITHNYLRSHELNLWFTITASSEERIQEIIDRIKQQTGIEEIMQLNSLQSFKLKVQFDVGGNSHAE